MTAPPEVSGAIRSADTGPPVRLHPEKMLLTDCREEHLPFDGLLRDATARFGVDARALAVRTLLHLPRVADVRGRVTAVQVRHELQRSAQQLLKDLRAAEAVVPHDKVELAELEFGPVDERIATVVLSRLHYLRGNRPGALHYGLHVPGGGLPVALCSVSPVEWRLVANALKRRFDIQRTRIWDVSRVFSFEVAPPNSISYLLSRVRAQVRQNPPEVAAAWPVENAITGPGPWEDDLLVTAVDPNLGFSGASYRAANWQQWMTVQARPYLYHRKNYTSPRQLRSRFGTANLEALRRQHPGDFQMSRAPLLNSLIYCCTVKGTTPVIPPDDRPRLRR